MFDSPERYGKGLDWTGYTVHDAANIFRRYLNQLPQPIVPLEFYERFREPLRNHQTHALGDTEAMAQQVPDFDHDKAIRTYQRLITELPSLNRQLLLYILDLLAVFASKSDVNLMTSANLAAIFQPGLLSHPNHDMSPQEYRLSQDVLIFLIDNQDSFLIGMSGTAVDEKTVQEVQAGASPRQQSGTSRATQAGLGRSASNASAGADSRRFSGIRRNVSVSSRGSKHSSSQGPATPSSGVFAPSGGGVYRSNTVPSKKSPALSSKRYARGVDSPNTPLALSPGLASSSARSTSPAKSSLKVPEPQGQSASQASSPRIDRSLAPSSTTAQASETSGHSSERLLPNETTASQVTSKESPNLRPSLKTRKVSDILSNAISGGASDKEPGRQPNKLRKKRAPSGLQPSAHSSSNSLTAAEDSPSEGAFRTPMMTPGVGAQTLNEPILETPAQGFENLPTKNDASNSPSNPELQATRSPPKLQDTQKPSEMTLKAKSPANSVHSKSSVTDLSEQDHDDLRPEGSSKKKSRWRFSHSTRKDAAAQQSRSPARVGANAGAEKSSSSISSWHKSRKSMSNDGPSEANEPVPAIPPQHVNTDESKSKESEEHQEGSGERKGFFGKMIAKVSHAREERKERESEKDRAKSPSRDTERSGSKQSLTAIANDSLPMRGRSIDLSQQPILEATAEKEGEQSEVKAAAL